MISLYNTRMELYKALLPRNTIGAELGVENGDNAIVLLEEVAPKKLYLVDPYRYPGGEERYKQLVSRFNDNKLVEIVYNGDVVWLRGLADKSLDWIYIDTLHSYEHTKLELQSARGKVTQIIAGHDWCCTWHDHHDQGYAKLWQGGVMRAVIEEIQEGYLELIGMTLPNENHRGYDRYPSWACHVK